MKHQDLDQAIYIKYNNREWCVWLNQKDELIGIPVDEQEASMDELFSLEQYLYNEGFFEAHYKRKLEEAEDTY